jgi:hypothetical protein
MRIGLTYLMMSVALRQRSNLPLDNAAYRPNVKRSYRGGGVMRLSPIAICLFMSTLAAFAQDDSGGITGVVTDQDGVVVSGSQNGQRQKDYSGRWPQRVWRIAE